MEFSLIIPAFIAGLLTFLAPCTLPLVPAYLGFISGVSLHDLQNPEKARGARRKIVLNGVFYVIGFSAIFIALGTLFGFIGSAFIEYQVWLRRIGGAFVILFGLFMLNVFKLPLFDFLQGEYQPSFVRYIKPGSPVSSFVFGSAFAIGWTPCVGPVLGAILTLAATSTTALQGAFLLFVFSAGLAVPFLAVAAGVGSASPYLQRFTHVLKWISVVGGLFLIVIGFLLLTNQFSAWLVFAYQLFSFINYDTLLNYL